MAISKCSAILFVAISCVVAVSCNNNDSPSIIDETFFLTLKTQFEYAEGGSFPINLVIIADLRGSISGSLPDGEPVVFSSSGGSFENGQPQIEELTSEGSATAILQIIAPGMYEINVAFDKASAATVALTVSEDGEAVFNN